MSGLAQREAKETIASGGKKEGAPQAGPSPLWLGDELEFWPERQVPLLKVFDIHFSRF